MATIINNDPNPTVVEKTVRVEDSTTGWAVAVVILIAVIIGGGYAWTHYHRTAAAPASGGTNINVTLPAGNSNTGSNSGAAQ